LSEDFINLGEIGRGAYGIVYKMKYRQGTLPNDTLCDDVYVIKKIHISPQKQADRIKAENEGATMFKLVNPFLIRCFGAFYEKDDLCLILEYCENGTLDSYLKQKESLSVAEMLTMCWQLCEGVAFLHKNNIVHRDLKSTNIFLRKDKTIKIGDFGSSKDMAMSRDMMQTHVGTPLYMPPEVILRRPYSHKADIWSLGCLLYLILSRAHPFQSSDLLSLYFSVLHEKPKPLVGDGVVVVGSNTTAAPQCLCAVVMSMLQRDARARPDIREVLKNGYVYS
jgi:NIMA (never in mitosis gene a)-related kinase